MKAGPVLAALGLAAATLLHGHEADACTEIMPALVLPRFTAAPRNAHVWVYGLPIELTGGASLALVKSDAPAQPLPVETRRWWNGIWQLVPQAPLAPDASYELWGLPHRGKKEPRLLGAFRTSAADDVTAPSAPQLKTAEQHSGSLVGCSDTIEVTGTPGADASGDVLHAVWRSEPDGHIAYDRPPDDLVFWSSPSAYERFPSLYVKATFRSAGRRRLGIRTVDVAGNLSAPAEVELR